jgi:hypothetical protein
LVCDAWDYAQKHPTIPPPGKDTLPPPPPPPPQNPNGFPGDPVSIINVGENYIIRKVGTNDVLTGKPTSRHIDLDSLILAPFAKGATEQVWTFLRAKEDKYYGLVNVKTGKYLGHDESSSRAVASAPWLRSWEMLQVVRKPSGHDTIRIHVDSAVGYSAVINNGTTLGLTPGAGIDFDLYKT